MAATAWDEGIDFYAAASPRSGHAWCQAAVTIAKVTNGLLAQQVRLDIVSLSPLPAKGGCADPRVRGLATVASRTRGMQKRYGGEERDHLVT